VSASYGPISGTGTITYTDGSTQSYTITSPDWWSTTPPSGGALAVSSAYQNRQGNTTYAQSGNIFSATVALTAGKTVASVTLPPGGALTSGTPALHVFAIAASGGGSAEGPYGGTPAAIPGTVLAADYDTGGQGVAYNVTSVNGTANSYRSDGVDLEACSDTGCGYDIGWTSAGQWFKYTVNVATAGTYTVSFRVASPSGVTDAFHIANSAGTSLSGAVNVSDTGGWQDWATATATVTLPAGRQTLTVDQDNGGWNLYSMNFAASGGGSVNLALNQPAAASSDYQSYVPSNVTDGNTSTYWESTDGAGYPQTITVNLGSAQSIGSITLDLPPATAWSTRTETLSVLGSANGTTFSQLVASAGYTFNPSTGNTVTISLPSGTSAQYVQLSFTANTGWDAAQLSEFEIFP
jgi:hypothetical protein